MLYYSLFNNCSDYYRYNYCQLVDITVKKSMYKKTKLKILIQIQIFDKKIL